MNDITALYTPAFFLATVSAAIVTVTAWKRRPAPGASGLAMMSTATCIWSLAYLLQWTFAQHEPSLFFYVMRQTGIIGGSSGALILALQYTHRTRWLTRKTYALLIALGVLILLVILLDPVHHLYFGSAQPLMHLSHAGPLFSLASMYLYTLMLLAFGLLARNLWKGNRIARPQVYVLMFAFAFPTTIMALNTLGIQVLPYINSGSLALAITGPLTAFALFRIGLLRYMPFARDLLIEKLPDGVIVVDPDMRILDMNPAARKMTGTHSVSLGQPIGEVIPELDTPDQALSIILNSDSATFEIRLGSACQRIVEVSASAVRESIGARVGTLFTLRDTTEHHRIMSDLETRTADLTATLERSSLVLATINEGALLVDRDCRLLRANGSADRILQASFMAGEGSLVEELTNVFPAQQLAELARKNMQTVTKTLTMSDGRLVTVEVIPLAKGLPHGAQTLFILRDETERRTAKHIQRDLFGNISHELRTPLTGLLLLADNLPIAVHEDPDQVDYFVERLGGEVRRMVNMTDELLTLLRIEDVSRENKAVMVKLNLSDSVREMARVAEPLAAKKQQTLAVDTTTDITILGDEPSIQALIVSLVENAIRYTGNGGHITVETCRETDDEGLPWAILKVTDDGVGISPANQERIFERFFRVDRARSRSTAGTGLGLSIVQHAAAQHGGLVEVDSELGVGTVFTVRIPLAR